jgi:hypothetical protein
MDRDLRVPYVMSDDSIDLIRAMLDRDVDSRITMRGDKWLGFEDLFIISEAKLGSNRI